MVEIKELDISKNVDIYRYFELNSLQIQKLFRIKASTVFSESNAKKNFNKVLDMIKSNFYNDKTNNYAALFLYPICDRDVYQIRKEAFLGLDGLNVDAEFVEELKELICGLDKFVMKVGFSKTIYTLDGSSQKVLFDRYKITAHLVGKKELEDIVANETDFIVISEEDLYTEADVYSLEEFVKIIRGAIIKKNKNLILDLIRIFQISCGFKDEICNAVKLLSSGYDLNLDLDFDALAGFLNTDNTLGLKELSSRVLMFDEEVANLNNELKDVIAGKKLSLEGDELLELLNSGDVSSLQDKFKAETREIISKYEKEIIDDFKKVKISVTSVFENSNYPVEIDREVKDDILRQIDLRASGIEFEEYESLGKFDFKCIKDLLSYAYFVDFFYGISKFVSKYELEYPELVDDKILMNRGRNIYINNAMPIDYGLGVENVGGKDVVGEKISILTGANSGGKTTLLEMFLQAQILTCMGLGINAESSSSMRFFDRVIYLKKFTGTVGSGAFEQTIRNLVEIIDSDESKLILIDEFEAITEPGAAAKILIEFLVAISSGDNFCIGVSHLGIEIKKFIAEMGIDSIRIDGISAVGLDEKGNLITNHQPEFNVLGKSTPELILKKILQDDKFWSKKSSRTREILERISGK